MDRAGRDETGSAAGGLEKCEGMMVIFRMLEDTCSIFAGAMGAFAAVSVWGLPNHSVSYFVVLAICAWVGSVIFGELRIVT